VLEGGNDTLPSKLGFRAFEDSSGDGHKLTALDPIIKSVTLYTLTPEPGPGDNVPDGN